MTIPFTSYDQSMARGFAGMVADQGENDILGYRNDESSETPLGIMVMQNTAAGKDDGAKLPASSAAKMLGVVVHSHSRNPTGLSSAAYEAGARMNVLRSGRALVTVEEDVTTASAVYVRYADGVADPTKTQKGSFRASADTSTAVLVKGANYVTTATAGNLAVVEFDLPASRT